MTTLMSCPRKRTTMTPALCRRRRASAHRKSRLSKRTTTSCPRKRKRTTLPPLARTSSQTWMMKEKMRLTWTAAASRPRPRSTRSTRISTHALTSLRSAQTALSRIDDVDLPNGWPKGDPYARARRRSPRRALTAARQRPVRRAREGVRPDRGDDEAAGEDGAADRVPAARDPAERGGRRGVAAAVRLPLHQPRARAPPAPHALALTARAARAGLRRDRARDRREPAREGDLGQHRPVRGDGEGGAQEGGRPRARRAALEGRAEDALQAQAAHRSHGVRAAEGDRAHVRQRGARRVGAAWTRGR
jgi:hypothetical protein